MVTPIRLNELLSGDAFCELGDGTRKIYGPVSHVQSWGGEFVSVYFRNGGEYAPGHDVHGFTRVALLHREADCEHGVHPDLCWDACWAL